MFKIYSLALLSFLYIQNSYAADEKEEFPGEAAIRRRVATQQNAMQDLQLSFQELLQESKKNFSQFSNSSKHENVSKEEEISNLASFRMKSEYDQKIRKFERCLDIFKINLLNEGNNIIEENRREAAKQKWERESKLETQKLEMEKKILEKKASYKEMGIAFRLAVKDGVIDLPESEKFRFMFHFPLTFSPIDDETRVRLMLSKEDQECLTASGENRDLIYNLMSSINVEIQVLHDMIKKGYEIKKQQSQRD